MADPLSTDEAEESSQANREFIGRVVDSEVETDHEKYNKENKDYQGDWQLVYEIEVLDHDWKNLFEFDLNVRKTVASKYMIFLGSLENIHGPLSEHDINSLDDLAEFLKGRVYEFHDMDFTADEEFTFQHRGDGKTINLADEFGDFDNVPNAMIMPVREVTDQDELAELGTEPSSGQEEEVDF